MSAIEDQMQSEVEVHLEKIERILGPKYKLTLIAKYSGDLKDADILLTMGGTRESILSVVDRFMPDQKPEQSREHLHAIKKAISCIKDISSAVGCDDCSGFPNGMDGKCRSCWNYISDSREIVKELEELLAKSGAEGSI